MRRNFLRLFITSLTLLVGLGMSQAFVSANTMSGMDMKQMAGGQCQSSCNTQSQPIAVRPASKINEQDVDPQPVEPYYLTFITVGWSTIILVAAAYLLKYLRWPPPNFTKLYAVYRF